MLELGCGGILGLEQGRRGTLGLELGCGGTLHQFCLQEQTPHLLDCGVGVPVLEGVLQTLLTLQTL